MYRWLTSQGQNFEKPLEGSTNYIGAYTSSGQLKRALGGRGNETGAQGEAGDAAESKVGRGKEKGNTIPPETTADLRPFPLNRAFVSQPVLSNELRETIWERVMKEGKSVREVSAELGVEMSRVGAVVRLKEIEKEWKRQVSSVFSLSTAQYHFDDDLQKKFD